MPLSPRRSVLSGLGLLFVHLGWLSPWDHAAPCFISRYSWSPCVGLSTAMSPHPPRGDPAGGGEVGGGGRAQWQQLVAAAAVIKPLALGRTGPGSQAAFQALCRTQRAENSRSSWELTPPISHVGVLGPALKPSKTDLDSLSHCAQLRKIKPVQP